MATDKGNHEVPIPAAALQSYGAFRMAVLEKAGIWFDAPEFEGRGGKRYWSEEVAARLVEASK